MSEKLNEAIFFKIFKKIYEFIEMTERQIPMRKSLQGNIFLLFKKETEGKYGRKKLAMTIKWGKSNHS